MDKKRLIESERRRVRTYTIGRRQQLLLDSAIEKALGIPLRILMEYAGMAVAREAQRMMAEHVEHLPVRIVCGHGQNAGDALVAARLLHASGLDVTCYLDSSPTGTPEFIAQLATVKALDIPCRLAEDLPIAPALIIDGVYGTGFDASRQPPPSIKSCFSSIHLARKAGALVLSVDIPSGLDADTSFYAQEAVLADRTVTFLFPKTGLISDPGHDLSGAIIIDPLSLHPAVLLRLLAKIEADQPKPEWIERTQIRDLAPLRPRRLHKGQSGRSLLVAGSPGLAGAALLAGESALRSGIGMLNLLTESTLTDAILSRIPEAMVTGLDGSSDPDSLSKLRQLIALHPTAAAIGPGIEPNPQSADLLAELLISAPAVVVDAGALTLIAADRIRFEPLLQSRRADPNRQPAVLTPHSGEFQRLMPTGDTMPRHVAASTLAQTLGSVVVLKGAATVIASPDGRIMINSTGNSGLARGGSGDVLTGLLLGLLAQGLDAVDASVCAVFLHGSAADLAAAETSIRTLLPTDVIKHLPASFKAAGWNGASESTT